MHYDLNEAQQKIVDAALWHINYGDKQIFEFCGDPGTGKSITINEFVQESGIPIDRIAPMAYTGQAAIVMRMKGLSNAKTVHSWIYEPVEVPVYDVFGNPMLDPIYNTQITEVKFKRVPISDKDLIIIDEGYMLPYSMKKDIEENGIKIIVTGDKNQLDPIDDKPAYLTDPNIPRLTQVMRQKEGSGIIEISQKILNGENFYPDIYGDDCLVIYEDELTNDMILSSDIVLCGKNSTKEKMNNYIRSELLGITTDLPCLNEKVICRKNNWFIDVNGISLANGLIGRVTSPPDISSFDTNTFKMTSFTPDMFDMEFTDLLCDYKYFISDYKTKEHIKKLKYSVGEKFDLAYCITTHLSQGAQFNNVIYMEEFVHRDVDHKKLNFVGATRAIDKLIYVKKWRKRLY